MSACTSAAELRRGEDATWGLRPDASGAGPRQRMQLLEWRRVDSGALLGRAKVRLPSGLEISDIGVFVKADRVWAQLPSQIMRDRDGKPVTGVDGKPKYISALRWSTRELQDGFSVAVIALIETAHGPIGGAQ